MKLSEWTKEKKISFLIYLLVMVNLIVLPLDVLFVVQIVTLNKDVDELTANYELKESEYENKILEIEQQNILLSNRMAVEIEQNKAEEEKKNPVGIPVSGLATIETDPTVIENKDFEDSENVDLSDNNTEKDTDDRLNPYTLEIAVLKDSKIIASGDGIVSLVDFDDLYGYIVKIDHQNGYQSVYRYSEMPKVDQGDMVLKGQMLYEVTKNKGIFAYHILYENTYINPFELIEISG